MFVRHFKKAGISDGGPCLELLRDRSRGGSISQEAAILAIKATYIELLSVTYMGRLKVGNRVGKLF